MRRILLPLMLFTFLSSLVLGQEMAAPATGAGRQEASASRQPLSPIRFEGAADPTGALVRRIDLSLPPFHGLEPRLALIYHSRLGDGPLGVGWSLAGLSTVQTASPGKGIPSFDATRDVYLLDGELLHPCVAGIPSPSCLFPAVGSYDYYFSDIERYKRIGRDVATGTWAVWLQNGTRLDYTEPVLTARGDISSRLLTTVTDTSGNQVVYRYTAGGPGQARLLAGIQYGKTEISLHYTKRPYVLTQGIGGGTVVADDRRLATVDVQTNGSRLRAYALDYAESQATGRSQLSAVQEFGRDARLDGSGLVDKAASPSSLPPTRLSYKSDPDGADPVAMRPEAFGAAAGTSVGFAQDRGTGALTVRAEALTRSSVRHLTLDLNGDGLTDHVIMLFDPKAVVGDTTGAYPTTFHAYLSRPGGSLKRLAPFSFPVVNPADPYLQIQLTDVDGDHRPEIVLIPAFARPTLHFETVTLFFDAAAEVFTHAVVDRAFANVAFIVRFALSMDARDRPIDRAIPWGAHMFAGDLNGDGYADLVLANPDLPDRRYRLYLAIGRGDGTFEAIAPFATNQQASVDARWLLSELNGDGRADLVFLGPDRDDGHPTAPQATDGSLLVVCGALSSTAFDAAFRSSPFFVKCQVTGTPAFQKNEDCMVNDPIRPPYPSFFFAARDGFVVADLNGDGSRDLVRIGADLDVDTCNDRPFPRDSTYQAYQSILSNGDGTFSVGAEHRPRLVKGTFALAADIEGDGRDDLFAMRPVIEGTPCLPGQPPDTDCAIQATVIQIRYKGIPGTAEVRPFERSTPPGLVFPYGGFAFGGVGTIFTTLATLEVGDFNGDGHAEISTWHRAYDKTHFLDNFGWLDEARTRPCTTATCPLYDVLFRVRTWQPGAEPIDAARWKTADVDGDGDPDYVKVEGAGPGSRSLFVRLRRPDGTFQDLPTESFSAPEGLGPDTLRVADVNADGRADLVGVRYDEPVAAGRPPRLRVATLLAAGGGAFTPSQWLLEVPRRMPENAHWLTADTNGDGKADLVYLTTLPGDQACPRKVRLEVFRWSESFEVDPQTGDRRLVSVWTPEPPAELPACAAGRNSPDWYVYDVDRNGTQDFVGAWPAPGSPVIRYAVVSLLAGRDGSFRSVNASATSNFNHAPSRWTPIDLNGDGLPELASIVNDNISDSNTRFLVRVLLSSGDGTVTFTRAYEEGSLPASRARSFAFLEWNGDGRTDLARLWFETGGHLSAVPLVSDGSSFTAAAGVKVFSAQPFPDVVHLRALTVDGSQRQGLEYLGTGFPTPEMHVRTTTWYQAPRLVADLLARIDEPFGTRTSVEFDRMTQATRTSDPAGGCQLPPGLGYVVSKVTIEPRGDAVSEQMVYACPRYSPVERSLWAWQEVTRGESTLANRPARTTVQTWNTDDQCGARLRSTVLTGGGSVRQMTLTSRPPGPKAPYRCETTETVTVDTDGSGTRTRSESFAYGELGGIEEHRELGDTTRTGDERTTHVTYEIAPGPFIVTTATRDVHAGAGTAGPRLLHTESCYDGVLCSHRATSRGLLTAERRFHDVGGGLVTVRRLAHDARGNVTAITDANGATTTIDYETALGLYPERIRNAAGHVTRLEWDLVLGEPTAVIDPNLVRLEERKYDALGRVASIETADRGLTTFQYRSWGLPAQNVLTTIADGSPSGLWSEMRFDGLGRTTQIRRKDSETGPAYLYSLRYGDLSDNPKELSHGALEGTAGVPVETLTYDFLERLASVKHPDGSARATPVLALRTSDVDELGHRRDFAYDAYGNVKSLTESGKLTATFEHDLLDRLTKIQDARNNTITVEWDSLGRVVREQDPDLGVRKFTYDAAGNLATVLDAKLNETRISYDSPCRPLVRAVKRPPIVTWKYDEPGHGHAIGRLTSVIDSRSGCAVARSFDYDAMGRVISETRCWDGISYTLGSAYDSLGRLARLTYPSAPNKAPADGEVLVPTYQANGYPDSLPGIVAKSVHDPGGRILSRAFANGSTAAYTYDPQREWPARDTFTLPAAAPYALTYKMSTDASLAGVSLTTPTRSMDCRYGLDDQHRLVRAEKTVLGTTAVETFAYDEIGNMTAAGAEVYTYPPYGPGNRLVHAMKTGGRRTYTYDDAGNLTKMMNAGTDEELFKWDHEGALHFVEVWDGTAFRQTQYDYDVEGRLIKVRTPDGKVFYDFFDEVQQDGAGRMVKSYYAGGDLVARRDGVGALSYLYADILGSVRLVASDAGRVLDELDYGPFGRIEKGDVAKTGGYGFTGARHDLSTALPGVAGSGLINLGARSYDPFSRHFVSPDTVVPTLRASGGLLRYAYALNSPAQFVDPSGHSPENVVSPGFGGDFGGGPHWGGAGGLPPGLASLQIHPASYPVVFNPAFSEQSAAAAILGPPAAALAGLGIAEVGALAYSGTNLLLLRGMVFLEANYPSVMPVLLALVGATSPQAPPIKGLLPALSATTREQFLRSATQQVARGGVTAIGRAIQKHAGRLGSFFSSGRNAAENARIGDDFIRSLLENPASRVTTDMTKAFGPVVKVRLPDGAGAWFTEAGEFIGLLEPYTRR